MAFPTTLDSDFGTAVDNVTATAASQLNELRRAVEGIEGKVGIDSSLVTTSLDYLVNNFFEAGRRLWLYEDAAPTGWTYLAAIADRVIGVKGGSNAFNVVGGNQAGTWTQPTHTHTGVSHNHKWYDYRTGADHDATFDSSGNYIDPLPTVQGSATAFAHMKIFKDTDNYAPNEDFYTSNAGTGNTGSSSTANTWRPYGAVGIIVEKD